MKRNKLLVGGVLMLVALSVPTPIGAACSYQIPNPGWVYMYSQAWYVDPCNPPGPKCLVEYYSDDYGNSIPVSRGCVA